MGLVVLALGVLTLLFTGGMVVLAVVGKSPPLEAQWVFTLELLLLAFVDVFILLAVRHHRRARSRLVETRFYVTDRRAIVRGPDRNEERIVELDEIAPVERACVVRGRDVLVLDAAGRPALTFTGLEVEAVPAIEYALIQALSLRRAC